MPPSYILVIYSKLHDAKQNTYQYKLANYPGLDIDDASPLLQKSNEILQPDHYRAIGKDISNLFTGHAFNRAWFSGSYFVLLKKPDIINTPDLPPYPANQ